MVQQAMTREFAAAKRGPFPTVPSLDTDVRPVLDRLTPEMLRALGASLPLLAQPGTRRALEARSRRLAPKVPGGTAAMAMAVAPLGARRAPDGR